MPITGSMKNTQPKVTRRSFLRRAALGAGIGALGAFGYAWRVEPHWYEVVERPLPIAGLPMNLVGKRMVQISDLHIGPIVDSDYLIAAMEHINVLEPDIIVCTGDWIHCVEPRTKERTNKVLSKLKPAKLATAGVLGNHDYGRQWVEQKVAQEFSQLFTDLGITILRNQTLDVAGLKIIGLDELWSGNFSPKTVQEDMKGNAAKLVLCHNPDALDWPGWEGYRGWILAGHTHGGQCKLPFMNPPLLPVRNRNYKAGEYDLEDGRKLYINRALGYSHRIRFNVRPEITLFTLTQAG